MKIIKCYKYHLLLTLLLIAVGVFCATGIKWGLPGADKADMIMPSDQRTDALYDLMNKGREDIYKRSNNSPLGRAQNQNGAPLSPILKSIGISADENVVFTGQKFILANFLRSYLLRSYHTDEQMTIAALSRLKPRSLDFNPRIYQYGGLYIYGIGGYYAALNALHIINIVKDPVFYLKNPNEMGKFFLAGRILNILFFILILITTYILMLRFYGHRSAFFAVLFLGFCPAFIFQAHIMKPYMAGTLFLLICIYFSMKILETEKIGDYIYSGLFAGLSAAAMPLFGLILFTPVISAIMNRKRSIFFCLLPVFTFTFVFIILNPYWIINFKDVLAELSTSKQFYSTSASGFLYLPYFIFIQAKMSMSGILFALSIIAVFVQLYKPEKTDIILILSAFTMLFFFSILLMNNGITMHNTRFLLPASALMIILAAIFIDRLLPRNTIVAVAVSMLILLAEIPGSAVLAKNFSIDSSADSTRIMAGKWINENVKKGASIGFQNMPEPAHVPPFVFSNYKIYVIRNLNWELKPDYLIFMHEIPASFTADPASGRYQLVKAFNFSKEFFGMNYAFGKTHLNSDIYIYKKVSAR